MSSIENLRVRFAHQPTFIQAVEEVMDTLMPYLISHQASDEVMQRLYRLLEPERIISFKVVWNDDNGILQYNTGYRIQFNSALGPYKGGLRFDASVNEDILKFLAFEQTFKNALTGLPLGSGKGGSDFDPKGKTENEIRTFCRAFMVELSRHIGIEVDVPAGDIGVGGREIGYMMGMYKELMAGRAEGVLTGKPVAIGGSLGRTEATGHGVVYFAKAMLERQGKGLSGMRAVVSGSGNVAEYTARQLLTEGAQVLTMSDRSGYVYKNDGFSITDIDEIVAHKEKGKSLDTLNLSGVSFHTDIVWRHVVADAYFPCATQNEIDAESAAVIVRHAVLVVEGANMPLTNQAIEVLRKAHVPHAPGKASNAGGVAVSGLEMSQNASHYPWTRDRVEDELQNIMKQIHDRCIEYGQEEWGVDYVKGANIAGAMRVLDAMKVLGW